MVEREWFTGIGVKHFNHVVERELMFCEFIDFKFLRHVKFPFVEKLENLGWMGLIELSDEVYP